MNPVTGGVSKRNKFILTIKHSSNQSQIISKVSSGRIKIDCVKTLTGVEIKISESGKEPEIVEKNSKCKEEPANATDLINDLPKSQELFFLCDIYLKFTYPYLVEDKNQLKAKRMKKND